MARSEVASITYNASPPAGSEMLNVPSTRAPHGLRAKSQNVSWLWLFVLLFGILSPRVSAQLVTTIRGQVVDSDHRILRGAGVQLLRGQNLVANAETTNDGLFEFQGVPLGVYNLNITARGFISKLLTNLEAKSGDKSTLSIVLELDRGGTTGEYTSPGPQWNVWLEPFADAVQFTPITKLLINRTYLLVVDLSGVSLKGSPGIYSSPISDDLSDTLDREGRDTVPIGALIIPNDSFFQPQAPDERFKYLSINLRKIRSARKERFVVSNDLFDYVRQNPDGPLSYGRKLFRIKTKDKTGSTSIALSFWVDGEVPVDETLVPVCIVKAESDDCPDSDNVTVGLRGIDSVRTAAQGGRFAYPNAALHFVELDSTNVVGVFKCNSCPGQAATQFFTWQLGRSAEWLTKYLTETVLKDFENAEDRAAFFRRGQELFATLFHGSDSGTGLAARQAFLNFVQANLASRQSIPSIFVRLLPNRSDPLFLVPLGLIVPPTLSDFLGFHFRVETPLEKQDYNTPTTCISNWVLLVPGKNHQDEALREVRAPFETWIAEFRAWRDHAVVYENVNAFGKWLSRDDQVGQTTVVILSHHDANRLYFEPQNPLESVDVSRINACGTGKPGAWEFVKEFNDKGASAAIATSISVDAQMAGLFMAQLAKQLRDHAGEPYTLGQAKFDATLAVSKMHQGPPNSKLTYGPQALIYMLAGNGGLKLCTPVEVKPSNSTQRQERGSIGVKAK